MEIKRHTDSTQSGFTRQVNIVIDDCADGVVRQQLVVVNIRLREIVRALGKNYAVDGMSSPAVFRSSFGFFTTMDFLVSSIIPASFN